MNLDDTWTGCWWSYVARYSADGPRVDLQLTQDLVRVSCERADEVGLDYLLVMISPSWLLIWPEKHSSSNGKGEGRNCWNSARLWFSSPRLDLLYIVGFKGFYEGQWLRARLCCRKISDSIFWLYYFTPRWLAGAMPCPMKVHKKYAKRKDRNR